MTEENNFSTEEVSSVGQSKKSKPKLVKVLLVVVAVILLGAAGTFAYRYFSEPNPEDMVKGMMQKMSQLETIRMEGNIIVEIEDMGDIEGPFGSSLGISLDFTGEIDYSDLEDIRSKIVMNGNLLMEGMQFSLGTELIILDSVSYIKLTTIPALLEGPATLMGLDLNKARNEWIKIDSEQVDSKEEASIEDIKDSLEGKELFTVEEVLGSKTIQGESANGYLVSLNPREVKEFLVNVMEISTGETIDPSTKQEMLVGLENVSKFLEMDIWIGEKTFNLYEVGLKMETDISEIDETEEGKVKVDVRINYSGFNVPLNIEAPSDYLNPEDLFPSMPFIFGPQDDPMMPDNDFMIPEDDDFIPIY